MLRDRLAALRRETGVVEATAGPHRADPRKLAAAGPPMAGAIGVARAPLVERLARISGHRAASRTRGLDALLRITGARAVTDDLHVVEWRRALPFLHGHVPVGDSGRTRVAVPLRRGASVLVPLDRVLFLDTETSGLAGGTGTFVFLLGLAQVADGDLVVRQFLATGFAGEPAMLDILRDHVVAANCVVTFNGKSFDVPLLKTRYALNRLAHPFEGKPHGDLLHAARRLLRSGWPDCRLRTTESRALGFERVDDLPGSEVPAAWQRWLTCADTEAVPRILDHNREDLLSLAAIVSLLNSCESGAPLFQR